MRLLSTILLLLLALNLSAQDWHADHFGGWPVPTITNGSDVATLPIPTPSSNIRLVSNLTTTNTPLILGNLTGMTISTTVWLECSNSPVFYFNNDCGVGPPVNMRLFFTTDIRPYTENNGRGNETGYWWCNSPKGWTPISEGTNVLQTDLDPIGWSDALGHQASDPNYTAAFQSAITHVAQIGFSFGGGCFYDNGVGISNDGASATLHVLSYDAFPPPPTQLTIAGLPLLQTNTIFWLYPPGVASSNMWWRVETTTDLQNWTVLMTNASGESTITVNREEPLRAYRLSGAITP